MPTKMELLLEAERRGILPQDKAVLLQEARNRGLVSPLQDATQPVEELGFFERVGERALEREEKIQEFIQRGQAGELTAPTAFAGRLGQGAGFFGDVAGEVIASGLNLAGELTPEPAKEAAIGVAQQIGQAIEPVKETVKGIVEQDPNIQAALRVFQDSGQSFTEFKEANPLFSRVIEEAGIVGDAALNAAILYAPPVFKVGKKGAAVRKSVTEGLEGASKGLQVAAKEQVKRTKKDFAENLIKPIETRKTIEAAAREGRISESPILKKRIVALTPREVEIRDIVSTIPVDKNRSFAHNINVVIDEIGDEANLLARQLARTKTIFPKQELKRRMDDHIGGLIDENPFLVGNSQMTAERVKAIANKTIDKNPATPAGLLKARKELDDILREQTKTSAGKTVFDSESDRAINTSIRNIRNVINDFIEEKAPGVEVKKSLRKQNLLFEARDNIAPKVWGERDSAIGRLAQSAIDKLPLGSKLAKDMGALATTAGVVGGAAAFPQAAGAITGSALLAGTGAATVKAARSPQAKKTLSKLLELTNRVIKEETDKKILSGIRADRLLLIDAINELKNGEEE